MKSTVPAVGGHYVFFLSRETEDQAFHVITAYEVRAGKIFPLDDLPQFKSHQHEDEAEFLLILRSSLTTK